MEVDHAVPPGPGLEELQRAHAAQAAHEGVLHHLAEGGGKGRTECHAAAAQHIRPGIRGARLWADDHAFHGV